MHRPDVCDCGRRIEQAPNGRPRMKCLICSPERSGKPKVVKLERPSRAAPESSSPPAGPRRRSLAAATLTDLANAGREDSTQGIAALALAEMLDAGGYTAQGAAVLVKAHREALDLALAGASVDADVIDMIFGQEA